MDPNLWAKRSEAQGRLAWLPLSVHLSDTQGVIKKLWEEWLSPSQRAYIQKSMGASSGLDAKRVALFVAAAHDMGKATPVFQVKESYWYSKALAQELQERLAQHGFGTLKEEDLLNPYKSPHALAGYFLLKKAGVNEGLASVVGAHHGNLEADTDKNAAEVHIESYRAHFYSTTEKDSPIYQKWQREQQNILDWALISSGFTGVDELLDVQQPGLVLLSGLLIMADWIASNEHYFPLQDLNDMTIPNAYERVETGFARWFKSMPWQPHQVADLKHLYQARFNYPAPKPTQNTFGEVIATIDEPGIVIFEAPMGLGKTESALAAAEQLAYKTGCNGMFFGLPTQATSDGMFGRVKSWLESITKESGEPLSLRLSHGKAALNEDFKSLASNINVDEQETKGAVYTNAWFAGRKTSSLDDFVVGTIDHFLLTALRQKHLAMRHLGFTRKAIILDEIHAADAYMRQYLYEALTWAGAYRMPVVILSATLPATIREEMVAYYLKGRGVKKREIAALTEGLRTTAYPLMTFTDGDTVRQEKDFSQEADKIVQVCSLMDDDLESTIVKAVDDGAVVGLIVNTVKRAQQLGKAFEALLGAEKVEILHSSFIATERIKKEKALLQTIGKGGNRPKGKLIVGTQVIEQSLDIDFDLMISDLAPMDLLIQRLGRLHRHSANKRPHDYVEPILYVLGRSADLAFEEGSLAVYGGYLLTRTQYFLPDKIRLPSDISPLVQKVYDDQLDLALDEAYLEMYTAYESDYKKMLAEKAQKAKTFCITDPVLESKRLHPFTLNGWIGHMQKLPTEEKARAQVRDIQETVEVIAVQKVGAGYGLFGTEEDLSTEISTNPMIAKALAKETLRLPVRYDLDKLIKELESYNIEHLAAWQKEPWLEGSLGIIFDESGSFKLGEHQLSYSKKYGLIYERM